MIYLNRKGQSFAGFRLLIGAVIGLFSLMIIMTALSYIDDIRQDASRTEIFVKFNDAIQIKDSTKVLKAEKVSIPGGGLSVESFSNQGAIEPECLELIAGRFPELKEIVPGKSIMISRTFETTVYFRCMSGSEAGESSCDIYCRIGIGKDPE